MEKKWIKLENGEIEGITYDKDDMKKVLSLYESWLDMNKKSLELEARSINVPEGISEVIASYLYNLYRTNASKKKGNIGNSSMDAIDKSGRRYQIKAASSTGPTSFSPKTNSENYILLDFKPNGILDFNVVIYVINNFNPKPIKMNKTETFEDQQNQGRRPRFSLLAKIKDGTIIPDSTQNINIKDLLK